MLFKFGKVTTPRCSFCKLHDETITRQNGRVEPKKVR